MDFRRVLFRSWSPVTPMPSVPHYVAVVVNLRGTVLPVIDPAARLGWPATEATPRHAIIVCQVNGQAQGLIVDSVSDIVTFDSESLQAPPSTGKGSVVRSEERRVGKECVRTGRARG